MSDETSAADLAEGETRIGAREEMHEVAAPWVVQGVVLKDRDTPYPDAKIRVRLFEGYTVDGEPRDEAELTTDAKGRFRWGLDTPQTAVLLKFAGAMAKHRGWGEEVRVPAGEQPPQDVELYLLPHNVTLTGRVRGPRGDVIDGAWVKTSGDPVLCDEDGGFEIAGSGAFDRFTVIAGGPGHIPERRNLTVSGQTELHADFELGIGMTVSGIVVDESQRPIDGAQITSFYRRTTPLLSGADGRFVLDDLDPARQTHSVYARCDGYVLESVRVDSGDVPEELRIVMKRGVRVFGTVTMPDGTPASGAEMFIGFSPNAFNRVDAIADAEGQFEFGHVARDSKTLWVERDGAAPHQVALSIDPDRPDLRVDIRLEAAHRIEGIVVEAADGAPVEGVTISVRVKAKAARFSRGEYIDVRARTGEDGRFELEGLPDGEVILECYSGGYVRSEQHVQVDRTDVRLEVVRAGRIAGRVVDAATKQPIPEFRIRIVEGGGGYSATWAREGQAFQGPTGDWESKNEQLEPGTTWVVEATADGYAPGRSQPIVATPDVKPADHVIALNAGGVVTGRVVEQSSGLPVTDASVICFASEHDLARFGHEPWGLIRAQTDRDGRFEMANVTAGTMQLAIDRPGSVRHIDGPFEVTEAGRVERSILLGQGAVLRGTAYGVDGAPLAGAKLSLQPISSGREMAETTADANGVFEFKPMVPGRYRVFGLGITAGVSIPVYADVTLRSDEPTAIELKPQGTASLRGSVSADPPVADGTKVHLLPENPDPNGAPFQSFSGSVEDSKFDVRGLPAGKFRLSVLESGPGGFRVGTTNVVLTDGQVTEAVVPVQKSR